jgi:hypothetical protein
MKTNGEFKRLTPGVQASVRGVVAQCFDTGKRESRTLSGGTEVYAYPSAGGIVAWGVNRATDGKNIARGVTDTK